MMSHVETLPKKKSTKSIKKPSTIGGGDHKKYHETLKTHSFEQVDTFRKVHPIKGLDIVPNRITENQPEAITIKPTDLWVDSRYQRDIAASSLSLISSIVSDFAWHKFKPPVVTKDSKGRHIVIDGQHTAIACSMHPEIDKIPAVLIESQTTEQQAESFIALNTNHIAVHPLDLFRASLAAGDERSIEMKRIMDEAGLNVPRGRAYINTKAAPEPNMVYSISTLKGMLQKYGPAKFTVLVEKITACNFAPVRVEHLKAFADIMFNSTSPRYSPDRLVETVQALDDGDTLIEATRTANHMTCPKWKGLSIVYKNYYRKAFAQMIDEAA